MPIPLIKVKLLPRTKTYEVGQIIVDPDPAGERLIIFDRNNGAIFWFGLAQRMAIGGVITINVPVQFATMNRLTAVLMDDGTTYDLTGTDKIQAALVVLAP